MFERTRSRLTWQFSLTVGVILSASAIFSLWMVQYILETSENNQLTSLRRQYASDLQALIDSPKVVYLLDPSMEFDKKNTSFVPQGLQLNQMSWVLNASKEIILQSPAAVKGEVLYSQFPMNALYPSLMKEPNGKYHNVNAGGRTFRIGGIEIQSVTKEKYHIFVGQEVTNDIELIMKLRWAFIGFACVMLLAGGGAGYMLAGRAMVPISEAYWRQEQFTSDASHELRTPLSILLSSVEVLNEQKEVLPEYYRKVLGKTEREIHQLMRLVDNLLTLARSDNGRLELIKAPFSLNHTVMQVIEQLEPFAQSKQVELRMETNSISSNVDMYGDEVRIRQLVFLLADNAIQYNRSGGRVEFSVYSDMKVATINVTDTGIGISEQHLPHIFERFYRMDQARSRRSEGTGLGLAIAKQIIQSHQGEIQVTSKLGAGTTFRITLPNVSDSFQNVTVKSNL